VLVPPCSPVTVVVWLVVFCPAVKLFAVLILG
jgi:hypothetical protein